MKQEYAEYLAEKARKGDRSSWEQLKRAGVEIEVDEFEFDADLHYRAKAEAKLYRVKESLGIKNVRPDFQNWD